MPPPAPRSNPPVWLLQRCTASLLQLVWRVVPVVQGHVGGPRLRVTEGADLVEPACTRARGRESEIVERLGCNAAEAFDFNRSGRTCWQVQHLACHHLHHQGRSLALHQAGGGTQPAGRIRHTLPPKAAKLQPSHKQRGPPNAPWPAGVMQESGLLQELCTARFHGLTGKRGKRRRSSASGSDRSTRLKLSGSPAAAGTKGQQRRSGTDSARQPPSRSRAQGGDSVL
jgi:hypothetical protein